jgi:hypothetical protein
MCFSRAVSEPEGNQSIIFVSKEMKCSLCESLSVFTEIANIQCLLGIRATHRFLIQFHKYLRYLTESVAHVVQHKWWKPWAESPILKIYIH